MPEREEPLLERTEMIHFRVFDLDGKMLPRGGATVCYYPGAGHTSNFKTLAVSVCSPRENYNRRRGKDIAEGRAGKICVEQATQGLLTRRELIGAANVLAHQAWGRVTDRHEYGRVGLRLDPVKRKKKVTKKKSKSKKK